MRFTEVEGKSKQDAIEKAARELNVPVGEIGIEVLSDSSRGFFSLIGWTEGQDPGLVQAGEPGKVAGGSGKDTGRGGAVGIPAIG